MARALSVLVLLAVMALAPAARAAAPTCIAPPGTAAVEQYCENLPGAAGPQRPQGGSAQRPRGGSPLGGNTTPIVIDPRTGRPRRPSELEAARATIGATTPSARSRDPRRVSPSPRVLSTPPSSVLHATRNALGDGGGVSPAFLWILVAIAVVAGVAAAWRRRKGSGRET